jgi:hypothetical protein
VSGVWAAYRSDLNIISYSVARQDEMSSATILRADRTHVVQIMEVWKEFMEYHQRIDPYYYTVEGGDLLFGEYIRGRMVQDNSLV